MKGKRGQNMEIYLCVQIGFATSLAQGLVILTTYGVSKWIIGDENYKKQPTIDRYDFEWRIYSRRDKSREEGRQISNICKFL